MDWQRLFGGKDSSWAKKPGYWLKVALLGAAGVLLLVMGSLGGKSGAPPPAKPEPGKMGPATRLREEEKELASRLARLLSQVEGAGRVEVTVCLAGSTKVAYATNAVASRRVTEEKDKGGGSRVVTEDNNNGQVVVVRGGQQEEAVVEREEAPRPLGVVVVADGAADPQVKEKLFRAVQVALGIEAHRVTILPRWPEAVVEK
ncbi:hypothetical protein [Ammonifex thiophilus]|uniref:Stage III sporulation protein AG n=1 Tax=Ammonifex thiophilus TaxID=444093 RepID=A0A3D8P4C5_9THEO|nr:hypothetical protein [Ammonifex thiophilus]RDV82502.1 hypothetical protein DXX99_07040 [Ammonifex thiophilus]